MWSTFCVESAVFHVLGSRSKYEYVGISRISGVGFVLVAELNPEFENADILWSLEMIRSTHFVFRTSACSSFDYFARSIWWNKPVTCLL